MEGDLREAFLLAALAAMKANLARHAALSADDSHVTTIRNTIEEGGIMALIGPHGSGKTARIDKAVDICKAKNLEVVRVDLFGSFDETIEQTLLSIILQLRENSGMDSFEEDDLEGEGLLSTEGRDDIDVGKRIGAEIDDVLRIREVGFNSDSEGDPIVMDDAKKDEEDDAMDIDEPPRASNKEPKETEKSQYSTIRRVVIVIDEFDRFVRKERQTLFYALLELVTFTYRSKFISIIAVSANLDATNLLEKRVKSRFRQSQSITSYVKSPQEVGAFIRAWLSIPSDFTPPTSERVSLSDFAEFRSKWNESVIETATSTLFQNIISRMFKWTKDVSKFALLLDQIFFNLFQDADLPPNISPGSFENIVPLTFPDDTIEILKCLSDLDFSLLICLIVRERRVVEPREVYTFEDLFDIYEAKFKGLNADETLRGLFHDRSECLQSFEGLISRGLLAMPASQRTASKLAFSPVRPNFFEKQLLAALEEIDAANWLRMWLKSSVGL